MSLVSRDISAAQFYDCLLRTKRSSMGCDRAEAKWNVGHDCANVFIEFVLYNREKMIPLSLPSMRYRLNTQEVVVVIKLRDIKKKKKKKVIGIREKIYVQNFRPLKIVRIKQD